MRRRRRRSNAPYRLASGDRLRVIVFGQDNLSNSYSVDSSGVISMPLIGRVRAQGLDDGGARARDRGAPASGLSPRTQRLGGSRGLSAHLRPGRGRHGGTIRRSSRGMTVEQAVAAAGGFTPRAVAGQRRRHPHRRRPLRTFAAPLSYPVRPGDTINVEERYF